MADIRPAFAGCFRNIQHNAIGMLDRYASNIWGFLFFIDAKITTLASLLTFFLTWLNKGYLTGES